MNTSTTVVILLAALVAWTAMLAPVRTRAVAPPTRAMPEAYQTPSSMPRPRADQSPAAVRGSDVLLEDYPLTDTSLATLQRGDRIALPHPDGGTIELRVQRVDTENGGRHLLLVHKGLVSTFTEARGAFFGTLATPRGVYALEGDVSGSRLTRHSLLDQRINSHALDYRYVPAI